MGKEEAKTRINMSYQEFVEQQTQHRGDASFACFLSMQKECQKILKKGNDNENS